MEAIERSQFHYPARAGQVGSIKRMNQINLQLLLILSQFHYGSIKSTSSGVPRKQTVPSQFHYGSIKSNGNTEQKHIRGEVSIPLWFD